MLPLNKVQRFVRFCELNVISDTFYSDKILIFLRRPSFANEKKTFVVVKEAVCITLECTCIIYLTEICEEFYQWKCRELYFCSMLY